MFLLEDNIGSRLKNLREKLKLTKTQLSKLAKVSINTIYKIEKGRRTEKIETIIKIKDTLKRNFNIDLFEKIGIKIIWNLEDLDQKGLNIIEGGLLGDGCIAKYGVYTQAAKDKKYLEWLGELLDESGLKYKITSVRSRTSYSKSKKHFYQLYTHSCPAFFEFRERWYIKNNEGKEIKRIPIDIKFTPMVLLHWYLGDGNLKHDKRPGERGGRLSVRLFTNDFLREDIELLLEKLKKDIDLNFYSLPKLNKNIKRGYVLHLYPDDLFKFFQIIGQKPPKEIENSITKKVEGGKTSTFGGKWPNEFDWIRILAKTKGIGKLLQERRKELGLTQRNLAEEVGVKKHHVSQIECDRKSMSLQSFIKILNILKLGSFEAFKYLCMTLLLSVGGRQASPLASMQPDKK